MAEKTMTKERKAQKKHLRRKVQFEFQAPEAKEVYLAGEFNNWDARANLMEKEKNGIWKAALSLKPGRYEYRFIVDGRWENDPSCSDCVPNEFGSRNCVSIVE